MHAHVFKPIGIYLEHILITLTKLEFKIHNTYLNINLIDKNRINVRS